MPDMLPNAARAVVPRRKLTEYLLAVDHPTGGAKAAFFRAHGFDASNAGTLTEALQTIARTGTLVDRRSSEHWTTYAVVGDLPTPRGTTVFVRTVWATDADQTDPRLVTAYPEARPRSRHAPF